MTDPIKRFFKAALIEVWVDGNVHRRTLGRYRWVQGWSEHPDGRLPHYPAQHLRALPGVIVRFIRKPKPSDWNDCKHPNREYFPDGDLVCMDCQEIIGRLP